MRTLAPTLALLTLVSSVSLAAENQADINYNGYMQCTPQTKALVQRVIAGFGGETALRGLHAIHKLADINETNSQGKSLNTQLDGIALFPSSLYAKIVLPNGSFTAVSTPEMAYMYPANATIQHAALRLNDEEKSTLTRYFYEEPLLILRNRIDPTYLFAPGPTVKVNGVDTDVLYVHAVGSDLQWFIDKDGRVIRSKNGDKTTDFADWRKVGDLTLPFTVRTSSEGRVSVMKYRDFSLNPQMEADSLFARPTLWMTRNSLPALGRRYGAHGSGFGDYVNAYMDDYGYDSGAGDTFDSYIYTIYVSYYHE